MHVFLLNIPRLEFAAIIPKGDHATVCMLGEDIDKALLECFLSVPEVRRCMSPDWQMEENNCGCAPLMNIRGATEPYGDRIVLVGDCAAARLCKDGIGSAYRTAKAVANAAVLHGVSVEDFRRHYRPVCRAVEFDNGIGKLVFAVTRRIQKRPFTRRAILSLCEDKRHKPGARRAMSGVLWDMFTGSASYRDIFLRTLWPTFRAPFLWKIALSLGRIPRRIRTPEGA